MLVALSFALLTTAADVPPPLEHLAILPVTGERISASDLPFLTALDRQLRSAVKGVPGVRVQAAAETQAHVEAARDVGLSCALDDANCAGRLAILAGVDAVVIPVAARGARASTLTLSLIAPGDVVPRARVSQALPDSDDDRRRALRDQFRALLLAAISPPPAPPPPDAATEQEAPDIPAGQAAASPRPDPSPEPPTAAASRTEASGASASPLAAALLWGGGTAAAIGLVAVVVGAGAAAGVEVALQTAQPWSQRQSLLVAGWSGLGAAAIGATVGLGGAAVAAIGWTQGSAQSIESKKSQR